MNSGHPESHQNPKEKNLVTKFPTKKTRSSHRLSTVNKSGSTEYVINEREECKGSKSANNSSKCVRCGDGGSRTRGTTPRHKKGEGWCHNQCNRGIAASCMDKGRAVEWLRNGRGHKKYAITNMFVKTDLQNLSNRWYQLHAQIRT